jgi:hypothetical protein
MQRVIGKLAAVLVFVGGALGAPTSAVAQTAPPSDDATALAKKLVNPVSDLVSVPFQFNWAQGIGSNGDTRLILNVQPVMPFSVSDDWNLIARVILPYISQPSLGGDTTAASGVGDVLASFFLSPRKSEKVTWGFGPVISLPSTTQPTLGSGKWAAGPTLVVLKQQGPWTAGVLWNQVWSFAGSATRSDVNQMFTQPFVAYTTKSLVTLTLNSEAIANWTTDNDRWTVPINVVAAKLASFGVFPASYQLGLGWYVVRPGNGPHWQLRAALAILLPRRS